MVHSALHFVCLCLSLTSSERLMYDRPAPIRSLLDHVDGLLLHMCVCVYVRVSCYTLRDVAKLKELLKKKHRLVMHTHPD